VPPPLIEGPDLSRNRQICDLGFSMNSYTGPGSHAGRGTPETSCFFAQKVLEAYWTQYGHTIAACGTPAQIAAHVRERVDAAGGSAGNAATGGLVGTVCLYQPGPIPVDVLAGIVDALR
jgi:serine/threonine kinase PknH